MRLYNEVNKLINIAEGRRKKFQRDRRWINQARRTLRAAMTADLLTRWDDDGAHEDFDYDEFDDEEQYSPGDVRTMLEKLSGTTRRSKPQTSADHSNLISEAKDRLIQLEKAIRQSGSNDDADQLASIIMQIEQMQA